MKIHKEGYPTLLISAVLLGALGYYCYTSLGTLGMLIAIVFAGLWLFLVSFFRDPSRPLAALPSNAVNCPADGKIVVIEETEEAEYFKDRRLMVSVFMSPLNVHINRNPVSGIVKYFTYHPGKYLAAWNPKSSTLNERTTTVYETKSGQQILMRQVAGALARRIVWYVDNGTPVTQGEEMGFIKLGSRVDLYFQLGTEVNVALDEVVKGNITKIATLK